MTRRPRPEAETRRRLRRRVLGSGIACFLAAFAWPVLAQSSDDRWTATYADTPGAFASLEEDELVPGFGRVRFADGGLRAARATGESAELAFNSAVYQGDRLETDGRQRAEIQLPDGSLVRLDRSTSVDIEGLYGPQRGADAETILALFRGRLQVDVPRPDGGERFRVDTPSASVYPLQPSAFRVDVLGPDEVLVIVQSGEVEVSGAAGSELLVSGESTRVRSGDAPRRARRVGVSPHDGFDIWVSRRDDVHRLRSRPGEEYSSLSDEVRPYYGELSRHGEWIDSGDYGWAWSPRVDNDWAPYRHGYWDPGPYGPVWVANEPWGWSVYRYGRWEHSLRFGWIWLPGSVFRPAHVAWYYGPGYVGWCPLGYYNRPSYLSISFGWGHSYFHHSPWVFSGYGNFYHHRGGYIHNRHHRHASAVRRELGYGNGVVTRRPVYRDGSTRDDALRRVRPDGLPKDTFTRAERLAERRASIARPLRDLDRTSRGSGAVRARRSFVEEERALRGDSTSSRVARRRSLDSKPERVRGSESRAERGTASPRTGDRVTPRRERVAPRRDRVAPRRERAAPRRESGTAAPDARQPKRTAPSRRPIIRVVPGGRDREQVERSNRDLARPSERRPARESGDVSRGSRRSGADSARTTKAVRSPVAPRRHAGEPRDVDRPPSRSVKDSVRRFFGRVGAPADRDGAPAARSPRRSPARTESRGPSRTPERAPAARPRPAPRRDTAERSSPSRRSAPARVDRSRSERRPPPPSVRRGPAPSRRSQARPSSPARRPSGKSSTASRPSRPSGKSSGAKSRPSRKSGSEKSRSSRKSGGAKSRRR
ncbi:MAG: FecR domain-containing protein [Acidobacteriota bacterium]|nr:FecR domain-containing protein [Acidobacteriota bacterium]